jgi:hypothetical protein
MNDFIQSKYRTSQINEYGYCEVFTVSDKVIQISNRVIKGNEVYNGQLGSIFFIPQFPHQDLGVSLAEGEDERAVYYPRKTVGPNLELGYAITVHKSQGSEFEIVFVILPKEKSGLASRELLYTALTRSRKKLLLFLQDDISALVNASGTRKSDILIRNTSVFKLRFTSEKYWVSALVHRTEKGDYVRSKSEVIIANMLFANDISYKYEERLYSLEGKEWKLPDFTIKTEDEGTFYWEHLGRLSDPEYVEDWKAKKEWYERNGYGTKLITSDELRGFDSKKIEEIIRSKFAISR